MYKVLLCYHAIFYITNCTDFVERYVLTGKIQPKFNNASWVTILVWHWTQYNSFLGCNRYPYTVLLCCHSILHFTANFTNKIQITTLEFGLLTWIICSSPLWVIIQQGPWYVEAILLARLQNVSHSIGLPPSVRAGKITVWLLQCQWLKTQQQTKHH